jgi:hypothetical protein
MELEGVIIFMFSTWLLFFLLGILVTVMMYWGTKKEARYDGYEECKLEILARAKKTNTQLHTQLLDLFEEDT